MIFSDYERSSQNKAGTFCNARGYKGKKKILIRVSSYCADWKETSASQVHLSVAWMKVQSNSTWGKTSSNALCGLILNLYLHTPETNFNLKNSKIIRICLKARKGFSNLSVWPPLQHRLKKKAAKNFTSRLTGERDENRCPSTYLSISSQKATL